MYNDTESTFQELLQNFIFCAVKSFIAHYMNIQIL